MAKQTQKEFKFGKLILKWLWIAAISSVLILMALFVLVSFTKLPDIEELENPKFEYSTLIYTSDMQELGRYFKYNRDWVTFEELSPNIVHALISTEDKRFHRHSGIDIKGTIRAVAFLGRRGGASTITQQLAKLFFTHRSSNIVKRIWQKMKEWMIAIELEKRYTKEEILAMYLNKFDFLYDSYGISAAANTYFGKDQSELNPEEAAVLVGMLKNPVLYNPKRFPENATKRRMVVLKQMERNDFLTRNEYDSLKYLPLDMSNFKRQEDSDGLAPYFRSELTKWLKNTLAQEKHQKPGGGSYNIYLDGLKVYTTLNSRVQRHAEQSVIEHMEVLQERYFNVWKGKDPWKYGADANMRRIRTESLNSLVRNAERYKLLRDKLLTEISTSIAEDIDNTRLWDIDILRMIKEEKKTGHLAELVANSIISKKQSIVYKQILNSDFWSVLKQKWNALQDKAKDDFNKKVKMEVFAYNAEGVKDTVMTPLDSIKYHRMHLQAGMLAVDPANGHVKAWVGGIDHNFFQYDHVNSNRQVGSTFKPFVYSTAIFQQGISPCWKVEDKQYSIVPGDSNFGLIEKWEPSNADGKFSHERVTLYEGLRQSINSVSVWLMKELGNVDVVRDLAGNMGVPEEKIPRQPSICLGSADLSLMDMTGAYATFANNGVYNKPIFVTKIEDKNGRIIYNAIPEQRTALPEDYNYVMIDMLKYAARVLHHKFESELGGKTGTTNDFVDGWFMGVTPDLVVGTWVGGEDPWIRFLSLLNGQGSRMARPCFENLLTKLEKDPKADYDKTLRFSKPSNLQVEIDCNIYDQIQSRQLDDRSNLPQKKDEFEEEFD